MQAIEENNLPKKVEEFNLPKIYGRLPSNKYTDYLNSLLAWLALWLYTRFADAREKLRHAQYYLQRRKYNLGSPVDIRAEVAKLPKIPNHVGFVLNYHALGGLGGLVDAGGELCGWALGAGTPVLTIYERTGALKREDLQSLADAFVSALRRYYGRQSVPHIVVRKNQQFVEAGDVGDTALTVQLMAESDGKPFIVELAREFSAELRNGLLSDDEITVERIHKLHLERVGAEPDLLVMFSSYLDLEGFSPWLSRISELYCLPDNDENFSFYVFLAALRAFANVKVNLGA